MGLYIEIRNNHKEGIVEVDSAIKNANDSEMFSNLKMGRKIKGSKMNYIT